MLADLNPEINILDIFKFKSNYYLLFIYCKILLVHIYKLKRRPNVTQIGDQNRNLINFKSW